MTLTLNVCLSHKDAEQLCVVYIFCFSLSGYLTLKKEIKLENQGCFPVKLKKIDADFYLMLISYLFADVSSYIPLYMFVMDVIGSSW